MLAALSRAASLAAAVLLWSSGTALAGVGVGDVFPTDLRRR